MPKGALVLLGLGFSFLVCGQTISGFIAGTVVDPQQATIPGATVTAVEKSRNLTFSTVASKTGGFVFAQIAPGTYDITVEAPGFKKLERRDVALHAGDRLDIGNLVMAVGALSEHVEVSGEVVALKTESAERSEALISKQMENIAVNGRSPLDLAKLASGVVSTANWQTAGWRGIGNMSANGAQVNQNYLTINGISAMDPGANTTQNVTLSLDSVQEFKILTGAYQAEYGRSAGMQIAMVTKSGTSGFHGSAYWYVRNESLNANSWLSNRQGVQRSLYRYNFPGYTIGGPVYIPKVLTNKDKLFFFWSEEFQRQVVPDAVLGLLNPLKLATVPTVLERQGDFSKTVDSSGNPFPYIRDPNSALPCNSTSAAGCFSDGGVLGKIPLSRLYQPGLALLNLYPQPNAPGNRGFNYQSAGSDDNPRREDLLRVDYHPLSKLLLFGHMILNRNPVGGPYGFSPGITLVVPLTQSLQNLPAYGWAVGSTYIISPSTTNEFNIGSSHHLQVINQVGDLLTRTKSGVNLPVLYPKAIQSDYMPAATFAGSRLANSPDINTGNSPFQEWDTSYDITNNFSKVLSHHLLKMGMYYQHNVKDQYSFGLNNGSYNFGDNSSNPYDTGFGFANAAIGAFNSFTQASDYVRGHWTYANVEFYGQDTWKLTSHLTLDYGLRMGWYQPYFDGYLKTSTFVSSAWKPSDAPRLYQPALVGGQRVASDPVTGQLLSAANIGLFVPGTGSITNGLLVGGSGISKYLTANGGPWIWGPRFGFAWSLIDKLVIRGGGGIFYDRLPADSRNSFTRNPPLAFGPSFNYGYAQNIGQGAALLAPPALFAADQTGKIPTVYSYTLGIQSKLLFGLVLDTSYVGSQSRHLWQSRNINPVPYGAAFQPANQDPTLVAANPNALRGANALPANFLRPFAGDSDITLVQMAGNANYNSLQASLNRRFGSGLFLGASYTWSHNLALVGFPTERQSARIDQYTRLANYGNASYDRRQNFVVNYVYDIPRMVRGSSVLHAITNGWQISGVTRLVTGAPFTATYNIAGATSVLLTGSYTEPARIAIVGNPYTNLGDPYNRLNPAAFAAPKPGSLGIESGVNNLFAPGLDNWDLSIQKAFVAKERLRSQFRVDFFNAFNHTQFTGINSTLNFSALPNPQPTNLPYNSAGQLVNRTGFGTVSTVADPRIIQAMIRIQF